MIRRRACSLQLPLRTLLLGPRTFLMGILNVTPDSFSERGVYFDRGAAIARGLEMEGEGADIVDVGGESTRPGAVPVLPEEELDRVIPVIEGLRRKGLKIPISIDTYKGSVAARAVRAGAEIINDISGLRFDPTLARVAAEERAALVLMHIRGTPGTMQTLPPVRNIATAMERGLMHSVHRARAAGIGKQQIVVDPGIGFGKTVEQNFEVLTSGLRRLARMGYPLLVGPSRKSFVRKTAERYLADLRGEQRGRTPQPPAEPQPSAEDVLFGTAAAVTAAIINGAHMIRVHDVRQMLPVCRLADCMLA